MPAPTASSVGSAPHLEVTSSAAPERTPLWGVVAKTPPHDGATPHVGTLPAMVETHYESFWVDCSRGRPRRGSFHTIVTATISASPNRSHVKSKAKGTGISSPQKQSPHS